MRRGNWLWVIPILFFSVLVARMAMDYVIPPAYPFLPKYGWMAVWFWCGAICVFLFLVSFRKGENSFDYNRRRLLEWYDPQLGFLGSWRRRKASEQRNKLLEELHTEQAKQYITEQMAEKQDEMLELSRRQHELRKYQQELDRKRVDVDINVAYRAQSFNVSVPLMLEFEKMREQERLNIERRWTELEQDLKAAFIYDQREKQYLTMHQEYIFGLHDQVAVLERENDPSKAQKIKFLKRRIRVEWKEFDGRQKRLLQTPQRQNLLPGHEDSQSQ
jgi:hypothetical protein